MTLTESFVEFLETQGIPTSGQDLYIGKVPNSLKTKDPVYWIITSGGIPIQTLSTGEKIKQYTIYIYYRSRSGRDVEQKLFDLEELLNCSRCVDLNGFETVGIEVTQFPIDQDLDSEDRKVGLIQINIKTYKKEC